MKRFLVIFLLLCFQPLAFGQDVSKQSEARRRLEEEIAQIDNQLKAISGKQKATTQQLTLIQKKVAARKEIISDLDNKIDEITKRMNDKQSEINVLQSELDTLEAYYSKLVYNTYKNRDTKVWFLYILGSENVGQGYRRFSYLKSLASEVNRQGVKIRGKQAELKEEKAKLAVIKAESESTLAAREKEYKNLVQEENQSKAIIKELSRSEKQFRRELATKRKEVDRLNKEIARILSTTVAKQKKDKTKVDNSLSTKFEQNKGKLPWPIKSGVITERFGVHNHPVYTNLKLPECNGVTFSTSKNASVYCVFDGVVKQIVVMPGYNQCVLVQHGSYFTFYCKLQKVNVKAGQKISAGTCIGTLEESGANASELHFQIWNGTQKQNPELWLRR